MVIVNGDRGYVLEGYGTGGLQKGQIEGKYIFCNRRDHFYSQHLNFIEPVLVL